MCLDVLNTEHGRSLIERIATYQCKARSLIKLDRSLELTGQEMKSHTVTNKVMSIWSHNLQRKTPFFCKELFEQRN